MYRQAGKNVRQFPARHDRAGDSRKNNMRFAPTTVCRRTINSPFVSISIVCELSKYIELFSVFGNISTGEFFGSMAIWTTSCLWDVRSKLLAFLTGSGTWRLSYEDGKLHCKNSLKKSRVHCTMLHPSGRFADTQLPVPSIHLRNAPGARLPVIMKPPCVVNFYRLSAEWSKNLFTIIIMNYQTIW